MVKGFVRARVHTGSPDPPTAPPRARAGRTPAGASALQAAGCVAAAPPAAFPASAQPTVFLISAPCFTGTGPVLGLRPCWLGLRPCFRDYSHAPAITPVLAWTTPMLPWTTPVLPGLFPCSCDYTRASADHARKPSPRHDVSGHLAASNLPRGFSATETSRLDSPQQRAGLGSDPQATAIGASKRAASGPGPAWRDQLMLASGRASRKPCTVSQPTLRKKRN